MPTRQGSGRSKAKYHYHDLGGSEWVEIHHLQIMLFPDRIASSHHELIAHTSDKLPMRVYLRKEIDPLTTVRDTHIKLELLNQMLDDFCLLINKPY